MTGRKLTDFLLHVDFEAQIREMQAARRGGGGAGGGGGEEEEGDAVPPEKDRVGLNDVGVFDADIYTGGGKSKFEGYHTSLAMDDDADEDDEVMGAPPVSC